MRHVSIATMVKEIAGLAGTRDVTEWENGFIEDVVEQTRDGAETRTLTTGQIESIQRLWRRTSPIHFRGEQRMFVTFGATYEDAVTGFRGIATSYSLSMTGVRRVELTPAATLDGLARDPAWFDFERLMYEPDTPVVQLDKAAPSVAGAIAACASM